MAQTRRAIGLSPSLAPSSAHSSTTLPGCSRRSSARRSARASFPPPLVVGRRRPRVPGPGHLGAEPQTVQPPPAGLDADGRAPAVAGVGGHLRAGPEPAVVGPAPQRPEQRGLLLIREPGPATAAGGPAVGQAGGSLGVPALEHGADPGRGQPHPGGDLGRGGRCPGAGQEPEDLPVGLLDPGAAGAVAASDLVGVEVLGDRQSLAGHGVVLRIDDASDERIANHAIRYHPVRRGGEGVPEGHRRPDRRVVEEEQAAGEPGDPMQVEIHCLSRFLGSPAITPE